MMFVDRIYMDLRSNLGVSLCIYWYLSIHGYSLLQATGYATSLEEKKHGYPDILQKIFVGKPVVFSANMIY